MILDILYTVDDDTSVDEYLKELNDEFFGLADVADLGLAELDKRKNAIDVMCVKLAQERKLLAQAIADKCII